MRVRLFGSTIAQQYRFLMSPGVKIIFVVWAVVVAYFSGFPQLHVNAQTRLLQRQIRPIAVSNADTSEIPSPAYQIKVVAIEEKRQLLPTRAPVQKASEKKTVAGEQTTQTASPNSSAQSILDALNAYRQKNGRGILSFDGKLQSFAQDRANLFGQQGSLDNHAGFQDYINNQDGFTKLGFWKVGENSSYNHAGDATSLIENAYGQSSAHNENQLNSEWTHVGIGVSGVYTNLVFGGRKQ